MFINGESEMKIILMFVFFIPSIFAQEYKALNLKGDVYYQPGTAEEWIKLKEGTIINADAFVSTGKNSSVKLVGKDESVMLKELSAISVGSIKKMSTDELLLALAMENMINAPKTNGKSPSNTTATYGEKEDEKVISTGENDFGIKRLNGATELASSGLKESAIIFANETYRKYPDTKKIAKYRILFADIFYEKGLYTEALGEYLEIKKLKLTNEESKKVNASVEKLNNILLTE